MQNWGVVVDAKTGEVLRDATHGDYIAGTSVEAGRNDNRWTQENWTTNGRERRDVRLVWG